VALAEIMGIRAEAGGAQREIQASGDDPGSLLVDFLNQLIFLHETEEVGFGRIRVPEATDTALRAEVEVVPLPGEPDGPPVKGATFHQLKVEQSGDRFEAQVYLDV
jgi:protein archease